MAAQASFERRALIVATVCTVVGFLFQIVAICTNNWLVVSIPGGVYRNASRRYLVQAFSGLWRICRVEVSRLVADGKTVETRHDECESHNLFPSEDEIRQNKAIDSHYLDGPNELIKIDYTRTAIAFTIIALILMVIGHMFAVYTLKRPRYIIKRLTALLHLMTAACILVLNEVFSRSVEHGLEHLPDKYPQGVESSYGFSYVFSWLVFVVYVAAGLLFLFISHKRKADMADTVDVMAEQDEPMQLGRV
ncbi:voltage-dependent calcium channel gamma-1 subunit-like isoform X1 [Haliotis cracherodii]|uniref:voltage-dependent calcium channel gamma-1 subunit-like isoform X1 n=1 Tax=Haliotis cracherodii TaxID=6455 RepID=UPI0039E8CC9F